MSIRRLGWAAFLLAAARCGAADNVYLLSDVVAQLEKAFGAKARSTAWLAAGGGSTIAFDFGDKGRASFKLAEAAPGERLIERLQVEPAGPAFTKAHAAALARFIVDDVARTSQLACAPVRDDQDGMNAFLVHACADKARPQDPLLEMTITIQTAGGRNLLFAQFATKKR